jgi:hypothetical protein
MPLTVCTPSLSVDDTKVWHDMYGFIVPELQKGVIIGEWGGSMQGTSIKKKKTQTIAYRYRASHMKGLHSNPRIRK